MKQKKLCLRLLTIEISDDDPQWNDERTAQGNWKHQPELVIILRSIYSTSPFWRCIYIYSYIYIYIFECSGEMDQKPWDPVAHLPIWHHGKNIGTQTSSLPMGRCDLIFVQIVYWGSSLDRGSLDWLCILAFMLSWQIAPDLGREAEGSQKVLRCIMWIMWSM